MLQGVALHLASSAVADASTASSGLSSWLPGFATALVGSTVSFLSAWLQSRGSRDALDELDHTVEIRKKIEEDSAAGELLDAYILRQIVELSEAGKKRRDPAGIGLAIGFLVVASGSAWVANTHEHAWAVLWLPAAILFLFGLVGLTQDAWPRERDARGRPIKKVEAPPSSNRSDTSG